VPTLIPVTDGPDPRPSDSAESRRVPFRVVLRSTIDRETGRERGAAIVEFQDGLDGMDSPLWLRADVEYPRAAYEVIQCVVADLHARLIRAESAAKTADARAMAAESRARGAAAVPRKLIAPDPKAAEKAAERTKAIETVATLAALAVGRLATEPAESRSMAVAALELVQKHGLPVPPDLVGYFKQDHSERGR